MIPDNLTPTEIATVVSAVASVVGLAITVLHARARNRADPAKNADSGHAHLSREQVQQRGKHRPSRSIRTESERRDDLELAENAGAVSPQVAMGSNVIHMVDESSRIRCEDGVRRVEPNAYYAQMLLSLYRDTDYVSPKHLARLDRHLGISDVTARDIYDREFENKLRFSAAREMGYKL